VKGPRAAIDYAELTRWIEILASLVALVPQDDRASGVLASEAQGAGRGANAFFGEGAVGG
jgi:hypothetical protein